MRWIPSISELQDEIRFESHRKTQGLDGKSRYFKPLRIEMYSFLSKQILNWAGFDPGIYMCMESDEIWRKSIGWSPLNSEGLSTYLDNRVRSFW